MTNPKSASNPAVTRSQAEVSVGRGRGWLDEEPGNQQMAIARHLRFGMVAVVTLAVVTLLFWQLFEPFQHVNTHILLMSGERRATDDSIPTSVAPESDLLISEGDRGFAPADFVAEDLIAFQPLRSVLSLRGKGRATLPGGDLRELLDLRRLQKTLDEMTAEQSDVLIVYLTARTTVDEGEARFEFNVKPGIVDKEQSRLQGILQQLSRSEAAVKLLIIDAGRFESDPALGMVVNEFPRLLEQAVEKTGDANLWVLSSNRPLEVSHISRALERSVFGWFVIYGLNGAADFNRDRQIDLDELSRFVKAEVSEFVQQTTGGSQSQIPVLLWGGGQLSPDQHLPILLSVSNQQSKVVDDPEQWLQLTRQQSVGASVFSIPQSPVTFTPRSDLVAVPSLSDSPLAAALTPTVPSSVDVHGIGSINTNLAPPAPSSLVPATALPSKLGGAKPTQNPSVPVTPTVTEKAALSSNGSAADSSPNNGKPDAQKPKDRTQVDPQQAIALATLFTEVWTLRDQLEQDAWSGSNPSVVAPEEWRLLLQHLLMQERLFRAARISDLNQISTIVKTIRDGMVSLSKNESLAFQQEQDRPTADLIGRIQSRIKSHPCHAVRPHSLGLVELFAQHTGTPLDPSIASLVSTLDQLIERGTSSEFEEWVNKLEPTAIDFVEIRLARQLAADAGLAWSTKQFALRVCRIAEKTASIFLGSATWIGPEFLEAEKLRKAGERTLLDQIGQHREAEGVKWLRQALPKYLRTAGELEDIRFAEFLCDQLSLRLPQYVSWHNGSFAQAAGTPQTNDIRRLADNLAQLASRLDTPSTDQISEIQNLAVRLKDQQAKIEASIDALESSVASRVSSLPGDQLHIESLLNTTLPFSATRLQLLQKSIEYDRRNVALIRRPKFYPAMSGIHSDVASDWEWPVRMLQMELTVAQLGAVGVVPLQTEHKALTEIWTELRDATAKGEALRSPHESGELIWEKYRLLSGGLKRFYQSWVSVMEAAGKTSSVPIDSEGRVRRRISLRAACRAQQLLPVNSISFNELAGPATLLDIAEAHDLLSWQASRCDSQRSGTPRDDMSDLSQRIRSYRTQAAKLPQQPPYLHETPTPIAVTGASALSLEADPEQAVELRLKWLGIPKTPTWVSLHFDPEMIDVKTSTEISVSVNGKASFVEPIVPIDRPMTFELFADRPTPLRIVIRRREGATGRARLAVYAVTKQGSARHDLEVSVPIKPSLELGIDGIAGSWAAKDNLLRLHPFANRQTSYSLSLINHAAMAREVSLRCLAPQRSLPVPIPRSELSAGEVANLFETLGPQDLLIELPKIDLPADETPVKIPFPKPAEDSPAKLDKPPLPVAPHGLIVVVHDSKTGRSLVKRIEVAPQRPRRFLRPKVQYNADRERIEVTVVPVDRSQIPPQGVNVRAEIVEPLPLDAERELEGAVMAPNFEARLFATVPSQAEKFLTMQISVDDYPRAFTFRIPCFENTTELPPILDAMAVSITSPKAKSIYQSPLETLPVEFRVDAPDGAFQIPGDVLEVGIDRNNDRDFLNEPVLTLHSDRQVEIAKIQFGPDGQLSLDAKVGDFNVRVPATGVRNANTQILARLTLSDRTVWSPPVPVVIDGAPPRVLKVRLSPPGLVALGTPLKMIASATDNDLSGVSRIEAAFDTDHNGQIAPTAKLIVASMDADGNWEALIPVDELMPGQHTLLVRAVDRVGNVGVVTKVKMTVVSAADAAKLSIVPVTVSGVVLFKETPASGIAVTAESAEPPTPDVPKISPAETDAGGQFQLKGLVPGKWKIKAKGVVRNDTRTTEQEITIVPSKPPQPLKILLK